MENKKPVPLRMRFPSLPAGALGALLALTVIIAGCSRSDPEQRLRADFANLGAALDGRNARGFMEGISGDFAGNEGLDRDALHNLLRVQMLGRSHTRVTTGPLDVNLQGDTATVRFTAMLSGGSGRFVPDSASVYEVTTGWRDEGGSWRMYYAQWHPRLR